MRRTGVTVLAVAATLAAAAFLLVGSAGAANFGVAVLKDCTTPINVGDPYSCEVELDNLSQASHASVRVTSLQDVVLAAGGSQTQVYPINSSSFSGQGGLILTGGAGCDATGCTVPFGGTLTTPFFSHYAAQVADFPTLNDQATYTWNEICATSILPGCSANTNQSQATASADINPIPTTATTSISSNGVQGVTAVAAGSSVSDNVTVTSDIQNQPPPSGNVLIQFFDNNTCTGQSADSATVPLDSNGQALNVLPEGPLVAGLYGYLAHYQGSADGAYLPSHDDQCEPLRVVDATISITPNGTNRVGQSHTFTAHATVNDGTGSTSAPDGTLITFSIDSGPGSFVGPNSCTTSGGTGSCTATITSAVTGVTTVSAHTTLSVAGVSLTRSTDGTGGNSGPATKTWVDAKISIAPSATNEVNHSHTFTATLLKDTGTGSFVPAAGESVTFDCSGLQAFSITKTTDANGQTTLLVNSSVPGQETCSASSTLSVGGSAPFTVQTDGTGSNSGPATKTWVDARISITPNGTNAVGATHTFTGHVEVNDGSGAGWVDAPAGTEISFTIDSGPGSFTSPNPCVVSSGGDCQIDLVSNVVGTTVVSAHTTLNVSGVSLTRSTDGTGGNSGPATKVWVDANIQITPATATNATGTNHVLTITVNALGGTLDAGPHTATATIVSGPGSFVGGNTCTYTGGGASASCTVTITSAVVGTTVVSATSNIPVNGVTITRTTGTAANSASGGSDNASKAWVDANIQITPATATNPIGTNHVLTITVNALGGTLDAGPHTATASIVSGPGSFVGGNTCTYTGGGASASCTVTITSNVAGTTVIQATSDIPVNGQTITRTTGTAANTASGGSDNAQKLWQAPDANIQLTPGTATNAVGTNHTLHCHINVSVDSTTFTNAPDGTVCTVTITSGPGTPVSQNCTTSGGTGTCDVVITSSTAGTTTLNASTTVTVNGIVLTRTTDGTNGNSGPATKVWVDANIQITPPTATNAVGTNHVLTITVNAINGTIDAGPHTATASIVSGPGSFVGSPDCTYTGGAATASCTVTITSSAVGTTVVSATSNIPVSGQVISRTTGSNPGPGGSDNANKTWVDANISITPSTANNPIGSNHVLTITVNALGGTIDAGPHTATASIVSGPGSFVGGNTCTYTGGAATASCTVTITSSTTGTTVVSATSDIPVSGQTITRTTGTAANTASGGSDNASKNWADDQVTTKVLDASNTDVTGSTTITPGTVVHDEATVTKTAGTPAAVPAPTGTVTFTLYDNGTCNGNVLATDPNEALNGSGVADSATFTTPATAGSFSYLAHYNGDANYPAKNAACEPFQTSNPFGPALTPGFWKNHQAATTALLPITLGNYNVNTFAKAYAVFLAMKCSSPIDCLAGHLLAAKLDLKSGSNPSILPVIAQADALLVAVNYNGPGNNTANAAQRALALQLEVLIDAYTNQ